MQYPVFLLTSDEALANRVRRALAGSLPVELHCSAQFRPTPGGGAWLAILLDAAAVAAEPAAAIFLAAKPQLPAPPVLWLGEPPQLTAACRLLPGSYEHVRDYLDRQWPVSKLAFILQQHLAVAYLRRHHQPAGAAADCCRRRLVEAPELQQQLNNGLTGILGNAELLLERGRSLPPAWRQRLARITDLAVDMHQLVQMWTDHTAAARAAPESSA